jgi:succinate dehydrogenase / fumarate reductase cytochrome b subunit
MASPMTVWRTLAGKKAVMAVTGVILVLFIIEHMAGDLLIFAGPDKLNAYSHLLKHTVSEVTWVLRAGLLVSLILHVVAAVQVAVASRQARPVAYAVKKDIATTYAARTMRVTGPLLLVYVVYHLMMFTFLTTGPGYSPTDVYRNVTLAFSVPWIAGVYVAAMLMLGTHLYHGVWSMLQTLGGGRAKHPGLRRVVAPLFAIVVTAGYISIPLAVLAGVVK